MDKIAIITGVSREMGLGYETAKQLKELGFIVIITARDFDKVKQLAGQIGVIARQLDVTDEDSVLDLANNIEKEYGKIDVLINNAVAFFDQGGEPLSSDMQFVKY